MFRSCLICTDFADNLDRLLACVEDLSRSGLERVIFFHNVALWTEGTVPRIDKDAVSAAESKLKAGLNERSAQVDVQIQIDSGNPVQTICRTVEKYDVDVVIVGTPARSAIVEKVFGSTSVALARKTEKPLFVLRPPILQTFTKAELSLRCQNLWNSLLIPYDDSQNARYLISRLKTQYQQGNPPRGAHWALLWVVGELSRELSIMAERRRQAMAKLESIKADLIESCSLEVSIQVEEGEPLPTILQVASQQDITAIAISNHYRQNPFQWTVGSVASEILHQSWVPVLYFTPER
ncbi:MAG: universal stress protein [Cyanobacteria bacterium P01_H01_bin.15]